uniref:lymphatic vessel endothelial hyaluronic acid receptor 1a isoform X1 n=1 Tax=Semicossyphus pulcher TaxID=241346 RepID=UPI0037E822C7
MNIIRLCLTLMLSITAVISDRDIDRRHIRVFPAVNQSIAGVFQVTHLNHLNQPQYAFNASEARGLCSSLGVIIASKAEVQTALSRGLETCRFGWIDEHLSVIPRSKALSNCGRNQTGLVMWRASVTQKFDVFCFNESDAAIQLKDTTTDSPSVSTRTPHSTSSSTSAPSSSSNPESSESEAEPARFVSKAKGSSGGKAILIITTCALLLVAVIILAYLKMRRCRSDTKQQEEYIQTEEWTCVKVIKETNAAAEEDESTEEDDNTS